MSENISPVFSHLDTTHKGSVRGTPGGQACIHEAWLDLASAREVEYHLSGGDGAWRTRSKGLQLDIVGYASMEGSGSGPSLLERAELFTTLHLPQVESTMQVWHTNSSPALSLSTSSPLVKS